MQTDAITDFYSRLSSRIILLDIVQHRARASGKKHSIRLVFLVAEQRFGNENRTVTYSWRTWPAILVRRKGFFSSSFFARLYIPSISIRIPYHRSEHAERRNSARFQGDIQLIASDYVGSPYRFGLSLRPSSPLLPFLSFLLRPRLLSVCYQLRAARITVLSEIISCRISAVWLTG